MRSFRAATAAAAAAGGNRGGDFQNRIEEHVELAALSEFRGQYAQSVGGRAEEVQHECLPVEEQFPIIALDHRDQVR